jgi:hypothetical protein
MSTAPVVSQVQEDVFVEAKVYELPEIGMHEATITRAENLGIKKSDKYGDQRRVKIHIRIDDEKSSKGDTMYVFVNASMESLGAKSRLGSFLRQIGATIPGPGQKLNLAEIVGLKINVNVVHVVVGDRTFANVESAARIRTKTAAPAVTTI